MEKKLIRSANTLDKILDFMEKALCISAVFIGVFGIVIAFMNVTGSDAFLTYSQSIQLEMVEIVLNDEIITTDRVMIAGCVLVVAAVCLVLSYIVKLFRNILQPMKQGRPFDSQVSTTLKKLSVITLIFGIGYSVAKNFIYYYVFNHISLETLFAMDNISQIRYHYSFNVAFIIIAAVLYLLSYVFKYGEILQKESDEIL